MLLSQCQQHAGVGRAPAARSLAGAAPMQRTSVVRCRAASWQQDLRQLTFLPDGAGYFFAERDTETPVYGPAGAGFLMRPPAHASTSARRAPAAPALVRLRPRRPPTAVARRRLQRTDIVLLPLDEVEVSIVVLPGHGDGGEAAATPFRRLLAAPGGGGSSSADGSSCLAIVPRGTSLLGVVVSSAVRRRGDGLDLPAEDSGVYETFNTKHKRRTMKIKFTCRRCGATTIKPVNPHAWASGSVFAKCGRCQVTHKLIDNLKLFHELSGPVFGPGTQAPPQQQQPRGPGGRLDSSSPLPPLPPRLQLRLRPGEFPDTAGFN